jgi:hypothetical protein
MIAHWRVPGLALALTVGACTASPDRLPASDSAGASAEHAPPAPDRPLGEWTVTEQGLGPLHAGMTYEQVTAVVPGRFTPPVADSTESCVYAVWDSAPPGIRVMVEGGTVGRVDVTDGTTATAAGVRIGDAEARVDSLYPGRVRRLPHKYTDGRYLIVVAQAPLDTLLRLVFETDGERVTSYRAGRFPPVEYVEGCA